MIVSGHPITLTVNPAIDVSTSVERVVPIRKLRCKPAKYDPGGGGINVARVLKRFGLDPLAIYVAGGPTGGLLDELVTREGIRGHVVTMSGLTREDMTVVDESTEEQYRFVLPSAPLDEGTWNRCLSAVTALATPPAYLVASGSLPVGMPDDFYARIARQMKQEGVRVVLDTSGTALRLALAEGVAVVKPNLGELRALVGRPLDREDEWLEACQAIIFAGGAEVVALTVAERGALIVSRSRAWRLRAPQVRVASTVGAGDSFLGAFVWSLASGHDLTQAGHYAVAAGSAALLAPGTELCRKDDVERLLPLVETNSFDHSDRNSPKGW
jgi:6-phosphofructokinase 2